MDKDKLKKEVAEFVFINEELKKLKERKQELEESICNAMESLELSTLQLPDGKNLNYRVKESLSLTKDKTSRKKEQD